MTLNLWGGIIIIKGDEGVDPKMCIITAMNLFFSIPMTVYALLP